MPATFVTSRANPRVKQLRAAFAGHARLSGGLYATLYLAPYNYLALGPGTLCLIPFVSCVLTVNRYLRVSPPLTI